MFYTINENFVDNFFRGIYTTKPTKGVSNMEYSSIDVIKLEDDKQQITVNTTGHNPKDITLDATEETIIIKSTKEEGASRFVEDIDLTLTVGKDYDGTKSTASFNSGLLTIVVDKKLNTKSKSIKISY